MKLLNNSLFLLSLILFSCDRNIIEIDPFENYELNKSKLCKNIHQALNDSLKKWIESNLSITSYYSTYENNFDSVIIFNSDSTRFSSTINSKNIGYKTANSDGVDEIGGSLIKGKWYFYIYGSSHVIPRDYYQDSVYSPLSFDELSYIAHTTVLHKGIKKDKNGNILPNDEFVNRYFNKWDTGCDQCETKEDFDSLVLEMSASKYKDKLSIDEINKIRIAIKTSKRPVEPTKSLWDRLFAKDKIFESDEWKEYIESKKN